MTITLFIYNLEGGGAERVICNLANYLATKDYNIIILTVVQSKVYYNLDKRVHIKSLSKKNELTTGIYNYRLWLRRLKQYNNQFNPDCYIAMLLIPIKLILLSRRYIQGKIIISERNDPNSYPIKVKLQLKMLMKFSDGFIFQTPDAQHFYLKACKNKKIAIIPNAINDNFLNIDTENIEKEKKIVAVGRLESQKNHELLIDAFSLLSHHFYDYQLELFGSGSLEKKLKEKVDKLNLGSRVKFIGFEPNIGEKIKKASLYVLSSNYEGMPNSLIEAMSLGLPCIATNCPCGGPRFLIANSVNGMLVPVNNANILKNAIEKVLSNPDFALNLGNEAKKVRNLLAPNVIYKKWEEFIIDVVEK